MGKARTSPSGTRATSTASLTLGRRLARTPLVWMAAVLLLASLAFTALAIHQAVHMRRIVPDSVHLRPGDQIIEIAGHDIFDRTPAYRMQEVPVHGDPTVTALRDGRRVVIHVHTAPLPAYHALTLWVRFLAGAAVLLLGAVGFALRPGARVGWLFYLFCLALAANILFPIALAPWLAMFPIVQALTFSFSTSVGVHTFCELPRRLPIVERRPWLPWLLYVPSVALAIAAAFDWRSNLPGLISGIWSLAGSILVFVILTVGLRRAGEARLRASYRALLYGTVIGLLFPVIVHVTRTVMGHDEKWLVHLNALPVIVYPAAVTYALLRQNVLGADRLTAVVVAYGATLAMIGFGCAAVLIGAPLLLYGNVDASPMVLVVVTAAASLSIGPVFRRLKRVLDRRFQRDPSTPAQLTSSLREVVRLVAAGDRDAALARAFQAVRALGAEQAALYLLDPDKGEHVIAHRSRWADDADGEPIDAISATGALGGALRVDAPGGVAAFSVAPLAQDAQDELWSMGLALCAAVPVRGVVGGMFAIGPRSSGSRYGAPEQSQLALLAGQLGVLFERGDSAGQVGRYRLERRLGVGGMAEVHLAWQVGPGGFERRVALKQPLPHITEDPELVAMFLDEARLAANLRHPNIAQILEVGRDGTSYFIAMEYVDGVSVRSLIRAGRQRAVPLGRAIAIIDAVLRALECAHTAKDAHGRALGLVHRDVTPANLLVSADGDVKLVDFGVALAAARLQVTRAGVVKGTPAYMSPEQKRGDLIDHRSDLFAAAVVLHELVVGKVPWPDGPPARAAQIRVAPEISVALAAVLNRALSWDPEARFASAETLRQALLAACAPIAPAAPAELAEWVKAARADVSVAPSHVEEATMPAAPVGDR